MNKIKSPLLLFSLILGFLAPPSLPMSVDKGDLIRQTCKKTGYFAVCNSILRSDPRSSKADLKGLASISVEILHQKNNATLNFILDLYKNVTDPDLSRFYDKCIEDYGTSVNKLLPEAIKALGSKDYLTAKNIVAAVGPYVDVCEQQFPEKSPFSDRNLLVRYLSILASTIIGLLS